MSEHAVECYWPKDHVGACPSRFATDEVLDHTESVVFDALYRLGCTTPCDPYDGDDCASVAVEAVRALRAAGLLTSSGDVDV